jgi:hypothetical protein
MGGGVKRRAGFAPVGVPAAGARVTAGAAGAGVCVAAGTGAVAPAGGATTGGAPASVAGRPLLAAKGAVPHVPTQCSGAGGAANAEETVKVSAAASATKAGKAAE